MPKFLDGFLIYDNFTVNFRTTYIFKLNVSKQLYLDICILTNGINGILYFTILVHNI